MINFDVKEGWLGNLEEKRSQSGNPIVTGSIAVIRNKDEQTGKYTYEYISIAAYKEVAEQMREYSNNDKVLLCGKWQHDKVTDQQGITKYYDKLIVNCIGLIKKAQPKPVAEPQYQPQPTYEYMNTPDDYVQQNRQQAQRNPYYETPVVNGALHINSDDLPF